MEKKSERLEVRLGYKEKQAFAEACETQGDTPSGAIRRFINGYIRRSDSDVLSEFWRGAARRQLPKIAIASALSAIALISVWFTYSKVTMPTPDEIFKARDLNHDGQLKGTELGSSQEMFSPEMFLRLMDIDNSGGITPDEFITKGYMGYMFTGPKDNPALKMLPRDDEFITVLEFIIKKEHVLNKRTETVDNVIFQSGQIAFKNLDRVVMWHENGGVTVLNGPVTIGREIGGPEINP